MCLHKHTAPIRCTQTLKVAISLFPRATDISNMET